MGLRSLSDLKALQSAAAANGNGSAALIAGYNNVILQITGTFTATVNFEATLDGATWVAVSCVDLNSTTRARATTATAAGLFMLDGIAGLQQVRARVSGYSSGSVTVQMVGAE